MDPAARVAAVPSVGPSVGELWLLPLDRARAAFNRVLLATPLAPSLVRKDTRIALRAIVGISIAFGLTLFAPVALFAIAPVVLGVPHLAADVRYLLLRPRHGTLVRALLVTGCIPFVVLRLLPLLGVGVPHVAALELGFASVALLAAALVAGLGARRYGRVAIAAPTLVLVAVLALSHADLARIAFAHLHNVIAIVLWMVLFRARRGTRLSTWLPIAFACLATALVLAVGAGLSDATMQETHFGLRLSTLAGWLAPGLPLRVGVALVLSYVFLQSVHYTIWLGLIPAEAVRGEAVRSFRMSLRALLRDFGDRGLALVAVASVATFAIATRDLNHTRDAYLTLSAFHGYLELAVLVIALCGRPSLWMGSARAS